MTGFKYCYVCDTEVPKVGFKDHQDDHKDILKTMKFSNNTKDYVRTACKICGDVLVVTRMRGHTKSTHKMIITEYKLKFKQQYYDLIEKVLHKCGICGEILLLDSDVIAHHLYKKVTHSISHKDYNAKYLTLTRNVNTTKTALKQNGVEVKDEDKEMKVEKIVGGNLSTEIVQEKSKATFDQEYPIIESVQEKMYKPTPPTPPTRHGLRGFHLLLSRLSMEASTYPALEALLAMENMQQETMIKTAMEFSV